eukprot:364035-Chlamydomonas_euryale.AAC.4
MQQPGPRGRARRTVEGVQPAGTEGKPNLCTAVHGPFGSLNAPRAHRCACSWAPLTPVSVSSEVGGDCWVLVRARIR